MKVTLTNGNQIECTTYEYEILCSKGLMNPESITISSTCNEDKSLKKTFKIED